MVNIRNIINFKRYGRRGRIVYALAAGVMLFSAVLPTVQFIRARNASLLSAQSERLLDVPSAKLARQFSYDPAQKSYYFNKENRYAGSDNSGPVAAVTGTDGAKNSLYSVDMPERLEDGFRYYDNNLQLSFRVVPAEQKGKGEISKNRLVYKQSNGTAMVFTAKANGIKEDILLNKAPSTDEMNWTYNLDLPDTLQARLTDDGGLGIYSADPSLFGNISYGSTADRERIRSARTSGVKNYLVFGLPAPVIKETNDTRNAAARFKLDASGTKLTVTAEGLSKASYPLSVDPSVVVTSTSDFSDGNSEDGVIDFNGGELKNRKLTGSIDAFSSSGLAQLPIARAQQMTAVNNGYVYVISDINNTNNEFTTITYAKLEADGTITNWINDTTTLTAINKKIGTAVAYNGYLYLLGGTTLDGGTELNSVHMAKFNADGSVGPLSLTSSFTTARHLAGAFAYNDYLYIGGGAQNNGLNVVSGTYTDVQFAPINANGTLGSFTATTSMPSQRYNFNYVVSNGFVYALGGRFFNGLGESNNNTYTYAPVNSNGTIGTWTQVTLPGTISHTTYMVADSGFIYTITGEGREGNVYQYKQLSNGSLGTGVIVSNLGTTSNVLNAGVVSYNGYVYVLGGTYGATRSTAVIRAPFKAAGYTTPFAAGANLGTARVGAASVAYNGYIYAIGGHSGSAYLSDIQRAPVSATGAIGSWASAGTALPSARAFAAAAVYNGNLYVSGGLNGSGAINDMQYVPFTSTGSISAAWTAATAPGTARYKHGIAAVNGYIYIVGGDSGSGPIGTTRIGAIAANGSITSWGNGSTMVQPRRGLGVAAIGNKLYVVGGYDGSTIRSDTEAATINPIGGAMTAWTAAGSSLATGRSGLGLLSQNGCLYAVGGITTATGETSSAATAGTNSVEYSCQNDTGSYGPWSTSPSTVTSVGYSAVSLIAGSIAVAGGAANGAIGVTPVATSAGATINNGGSGDNDVWGTTSNNMSPARANQAMVAYNGYLYNVGGQDSSSVFTTVQKAVISANGLIGSWTAETSLPFPRALHTLNAYNGHLYVIGNDGTSPTDSVYETTINPATGALGTWRSLATLQTGRFDHATAVYNGYLYVVGGQTDIGGNPFTSTVEYTKINADGTLQPWSTATDYGSPVSGLGAAAANGYVYVCGGRDSVSTYTYCNASKINANGSLGSWQPVSNMNYPESARSMFASNGYLYIPSSTTGTMQRAAISANGGLDSWQGSASTSKFTSSTRVSSATASYRGFIYVNGGSDGTNFYSDTMYTPLDSVVKISRYSKLIDLNVNRFMGQISYTGQLGDGLSSITYSTAANNGTFSAKKSASAATQTGTITCLSVAAVRYIKLAIVLDDSRTYAYALSGSQTSRMSVQDVTMQFETALRASTERRLFLGKSLDGGTLKPYDTCGV